MSDKFSPATILGLAVGQENQYDWLGAAEFYKKALGLVSEQDFSSRGEICERWGYALYRAAFQVETVDEFRERLQKAIVDYEKAKESYGKMNHSPKKGGALRCDAMIAYMRYWLALEVPEKKRLLDKCWELTNEALKTFEEAGKVLEYGKTYSQLASSAFLGYSLEWNFQAGEKVIREAMERGEKTITLLGSADDAWELARAYVKTAFYVTAFGLYFVPSIDERDRCRKKGQDYWQKACKMSEEAAFLELAATSGGTGDEMGWGTDEILVHFERALSSAKKTNDKYMIGTAMDWLAYACQWKAIGVEDPSKSAEYATRTLQYAEDAQRQFSAISFVSPRGDQAWTAAPKADYYWALARLEIDLVKRRDLLKKAVEEASRALVLAESSGYPGVISYADHTLSFYLERSAQIQVSLQDKKKLLEKALEHRKENIRINEQRFPFHYGNRGVAWCYLAHLQGLIANVEEEPQKQKSMLEEAASNMEHGLQLCIKGTLCAEDIERGYLQLRYGELLRRLYGLTKDDEYQRKSIKSFEEGARSFQKIDMVSYAAECYWKAANGYDALGEHTMAAESFGMASGNYKGAAQKIPQLSAFYQDHVLYMQAWSEMEKARHHHKRQEYGLAKGHFEKAADLHRLLKQWNYLAPSLSAWAEVEHAEELSRAEQGEEALKTFEQATSLFNEAGKSLQTQLDKIEDVDEKQMATTMLKANDLRHAYCRARIVLEEAKLLDRKGEHYLSAERYGALSGTLEKMIEELDSEQDRREIKYILTLSRAWQKMAQAEAEVLPKYYGEASQLFEEAKELGSSEKEKMLLLGHSRFCRALEAGTRFFDTRDTATYAAAMQHLESAADYYLRADFQNASEYVKATRLLLDAYVQMDDALREKDLEKKAKLYVIVEKLLQGSAAAFAKTEHSSKRLQVLKLLENVREKRQLTASLAEVLYAPIIASTTAFATPAPTSEKAVGLERLDHAEVQANIVASRKELRVGENLNLDIELANAGKGSALLSRIEETIPEGFETAEKPEMYRVEHNDLNMKGKRLDPLKTEEVRLVLKSKRQGIFHIRPKILYLDENGESKSHEPTPITVIVKELGIKGWLRGER